VAAIFVAGGLIGLGQLSAGDFVVTGSLPAKVPIVGVAVILYAGSIGLGLLVRTGRGWIAALNLGVLFAVALLPAVGRPLAITLGASNVIAVAALVRWRGWFSAMAELRRGRQAPERTVADVDRDVDGANEAAGS
jgi:hypothetical protein